MQLDNNNNLDLISWLEEKYLKPNNCYVFLGSWPSKQHQPFVQGPSGSGPEERAIMV